MKKIIRSSCLILILLMSSINLQRVNATEELPKYLNYNEMKITGAAVYKDKTLMSIESTKYGENTKQYKLALFENGTEKVIKTYNERCTVDSSIIGDKVQGRYKVGEEYVGFEYDFNTGELKDIFNQDNKLVEECVKRVNAKYNTNYVVNEPSNNENIDYTRAYVKNGYVMFNFTKYIDNDPSNQKSYYGFYKDGFEYISDSYTELIFDNVNGDPYVWEYNYYPGGGQEMPKGIVVVSKVINNKFVKIGSLEYSSGVFYFFGIDNGNLYSIAQGLGLFIPYKLENGEYKATERIACGTLAFAKDNEGEVWNVISEWVNNTQKSYVAKMVDGKWVKIYEVDPDMSAISIYDESNFVVYSYSKNKVTFVRNGESAKEEQDIDGDGKVDVLDLALMGNKYNIINTNSDYLEIYDLNYDGIIDIYDIVKVARSIGEIKNNML